MADKEKIKTEIERLKDSTNVTLYNRAYDRVLSFIDAMPENPVSEDLNKAAEEALDWYAPKGTTSNTFVYTKAAMLDMFREGSKWKEQQMMKDTINCTIGFRFHRLSIDLKDNNIKGLECGDKVKLIIIRDTPEYTEGVTGHYTTTTK